MTIHAGHPFAEPEPDPVRRFRGRVGGTVSLWTAGEGAQRAGLTLTSYAVAHGDPAHVLGLLDPDSDLAERAAHTGRVAVSLLEWTHRDLAETFAGLLPSPGGPFRAAAWEQTAWGPVPDGASAWVGLLVRDAGSVGWSTLLDGTVEHVSVGESTAPLLHRRGRYRTLE